MLDLPVLGQHRFPPAAIRFRLDDNPARHVWQDEELGVPLSECNGREWGRILDDGHVGE